MAAAAGLVELTNAKTAFEAEWIVGALKEMGVPAVTFGDMLADEYAMSRNLLGMSGGVRVMVPSAELERARQALAEIERNRPTSGDVAAPTGGERTRAGPEAAADEPAAAGGGVKTAAIFLLAATVLGLGVLALSLRDKLEDMERASPVSDVTWRGDHWERRWRHNGQVASISLDRDRNGVYEEIWTHDREGRLLGKFLDRNQNEVWELSIPTDPEGNERCRLVDADESGVLERLEYPATNGVKEIWTDANEDCRFERYEFVDVRSGKVLDAFEDRGREGYVRVVGPSAADTAR